MPFALRPFPVFASAAWRMAAICILALVPVFSLPAQSRGQALTVPAAADPIPVSGGSGAWLELTGLDRSSISLNQTGSLTLSGDGASLVRAPGHPDIRSNMTVADGGSLNFGVAGSKGGLFPGDIALSDNAVLNVAAAPFTVDGVITGRASGALVHVGDNATLTAAAFGSPNSRLQRLEGDQGAIVSRGGVYVQQLDLCNASLTAEGEIHASATSRLELANSSITSRTGSITLGSVISGMTLRNNSAIRAAGDISFSGDVLVNGGTAAIAAGNDIIARSASLDGSEQGSLDLIAGRNITLDATSAAKGDITALSVSAGGSITARNLTATQVQADTLTLSRSLKVSGGSLTLSGQSSVGEKVVLDHAEASIGALNAGKEAHIVASALTGDTLSASGLLSVSRNSRLNLTSLSADAVIVSDSAVSADTLQTTQGIAINGDASVTADTLVAAAPVLLAGSPSSTAWLDATKATLASGGLGLGVNSAASLGSRETGWLAPWQKATAATLGIAAPFTLATGSGLTADGGNGNASPAPDTLVFAPASHLVIRGDSAREAAGSPGAISAQAAATAHVYANSRLTIAGAQANDVYIALGRNITTVYDSPEAWHGQSISTDSHMLSLEAVPGRDGFFVARARPAQGTYPTLTPEIGGILDEGYTTPAAPGSMQLGTLDRHVHSPWAGVRFLSRASSRSWLGPDRKLAVKTMESAVRMALLGGVPQIALAANTAAREEMLRQVESRECGRKAAPGEAERCRRLTFWITPFFRSLNANGMNADQGEYDWRAWLGGGAAGAGGRAENGLVAGIALNTGTAYAKSGGGMARTTNHAVFQGVGLYGGYAGCGWKILGDAHYTRTRNHLRQALPQGMRMKPLKGNLNSHATSVSAHLEKEIPLGVWRLAPHAGARHIWLHTDSYAIKSDGDVLHGRPVRQSLWSFPVGMRAEVEKELENGWRLRPSLDVSILPAAGDVNARGSVRFTGTRRDAALVTQVTERVSAAATAAVEAASGSLSLGAAASFQRGRKTGGAAMTGTLRLSF